MLVVLALASAFMWLRSYRVDEGLKMSAVRPDAEWGVRWENKALESSRGRIAFTSGSTRRAGRADVLRPWRFDYARDESVEPMLFQGALNRTPHHTVRFLGLHHVRHSSGGERVYVTVIPYWMLVTLFGAAPVRRLVRRARAPNLPAGTCLSCGGDTRSGAYCPRCGAATGGPAA